MAYVGYSVLLEYPRNRCEFAIVKDLIDKPSIVYGVQTFQKRLETCLRDINANNEADVCQLVRNWYRAEDEPGMSTMKCCEHRLYSRQWLLSGVRLIRARVVCLCCSFPNGLHLVSKQPISWRACVKKD